MLRRNNVPIKKSKSEKKVIPNFQSWAFFSWRFIIFMLVAILISYQRASYSYTCDPCSVSSISNNILNGAKCELSISYVKGFSVETFFVIIFAALLGYIIGSFVLHYFKFKMRDD